jgi:DNA-binding protein HU-alpha
MLFPKWKQKEQIMAKTPTTETKTPAKPAARKTTARSAKPAGAPAARATPPRSRKAATAPAAAEAIAAAPSVEPVLVTESRGATGSEMKKRELVDRVAKHGDLKKKQVKPVVDAMLAVLGEVLGEGRELNLPPMGKMKVNRQKTISGGQIILIKLRTGTAGGAAAAGDGDAEIAPETVAEALAEPAE